MNTAAKDPAQKDTPTKSLNGITPALPWQNYGFYNPWSLTGEFWEYWTDAAQRTALFWDTLRQRGDNFQEHLAQGQPPVLIFKYELVVDGKTLPRPVNYQLLRIIPPDGYEIDPAMRPVVIVDPRAGHGPGVGGSKLDSEIGMALRAGHPVYFVSFKTEPEPGQTIADISRAEAFFLQEVIRRHPDAPKPCVYGNCQAGWAVAMLASTNPDLLGPVVLSGAPLSYWSGWGDRNAIRYLGGLWGGTWLTALMADLGHGKFDGANLVANFENLNPANTFWSKYYNLYSQVDTEANRYLNFEIWWNGFFLMTAEEVQFIVDNLFIGNRLAANEVQLDGKPVRLKDIKAPIIIFASRGDNISPPQQALNWIIDVYGSDQAIIEDDQVIVYNLHESVGHLGIFVGGKVAEKEHNVIINALEFIEMLPPGLYELQIEDTPPGAPDDGDGIPNYSITFARRKLDDIRSLDDTRQDEEAFGRLARVSEANLKIYNSVARPWVRLFATEESAELERELHPLRLQHYWLSSLNPWLEANRGLAGLAREQRRPVSPDNFFLGLEKTLSENMVTFLDAWRDWRDTLAEYSFQALYGPAGFNRFIPPLSSAPAEAYKSEAEIEFQARREKLLGRMEEGGFAEAVSRMIVLVGEADQEDDPATLVRSWQALTTHPRLAGYSAGQLKSIGKQQFLMLYLDRARAVAALPQLLPGRAQRREALELVKAVVLNGRKPIPSEQAALEELEATLEAAEELVAC